MVSILSQADPLKHDRNQASDISGKLGNLSTRLTTCDKEVREAQRIRYQVFCEELNAGNQINTATQLEQEDHDLICDHLLVLEDDGSDNQKIVGTQRFLLKTAAQKELQFRSQNEFDFYTLAENNPEKRFMELGRSCILEDHRSKRTMELMWHGTWAYAVKNKVDVMLGCASFYAKSHDEISLPLGFLSGFTTNKDQWKVTPTGKNPVSLKVHADKVTDPKKALKSLPPLIKGYLRLGAIFSDHAVIDEEFGTIDVAVILPIENINPRYVNYYGANASKHAKAL